MFTSRAEYRLLLREDNADLRLTPIGRELGVVDGARWAAFSAKQHAIEAEQKRLQGIWLRTGDADAASVLEQPLRKDANALDLLRRPEVDYATLCRLPQVAPGVADPIVAEQVEIQAKYSGYIERQHEEIERQRRYEETALPIDLDYSQVRGLSAEVSQKLSQHRPASLGQAARISGVTPAAISLLLIHLKKRQNAA